MSAKAVITPCVKCGSKIDLLAQFTWWGVCGKCTRRAHRAATAGKWSGRKS